MNQLGAMYESVALGKERAKYVSDDEIIIKDGFSIEHMESMVRRARGLDSESTSEYPFSEAKLGRWLGWIQAALTAQGLLSLEEAKEINKKWSDK